MRLTFIHKLVLGAVAGALLALTYAPFGLYLLSPLCFAALFYLWRGLEPSRAFLVGFAFGCGWFFAGVHWVYVSIHVFGEAHVLLAGAITLALIVFLATYVALTGWLSARWFSADGAVAWLGVLPALFVLSEWCRGWILSGFGWLAPGYSQTDSWLIGFAPVGGVYLMSWAVLISAGAIVMFALGEARQRVVAIVIVAAIWGSGWFLDQQRWGEPTGEFLSVALAQGAVPQDLKWDPAHFEPTLELYRRLTEESAGSDLIVWPEASIPALYERVEEYLESIRAWADENGSTVALGVLRDDPSGGTFQNAFVVLEETPEFYVKRHLVPYGEVFPVPAFVRRWMRLLSLPYTDAVAGAPDQAPLSIAGQTVGVTICYEDLFGSEQIHYLPEASLLVNVSNDAWFGDTVAAHQHLQIARLRAAEVSRFLVRSTNTGISGIIDPEGRVVGLSPQFEPHVLKGTVQGYAGRTPYTLWGNYLAVLGALAVLLGQFATTKLTIRPGT